LEGDARRVQTQQTCERQAVLTPINFEGNQSKRGEETTPRKVDKKGPEIRYLILSIKKCTSGKEVLLAGQESKTKKKGMAELLKARKGDKRVRLVRKGPSEKSKRTTKKANFGRLADKNGANKKMVRSGKRGLRFRKGRSIRKQTTSKQLLGTGEKE